MLLVWTLDGIGVNVNRLSKAGHHEEKQARARNATLQQRKPPGLVRDDHAATLNHSSTNAGLKKTQVVMGQFDDLICARDLLLLWRPFRVETLDFGCVVPPSTGLGARRSTRWLSKKDW